MFKCAEMMMLSFSKACNNELQRIFLFKKELMACNFYQCRVVYTMLPDNVQPCLCMAADPSCRTVTVSLLGGTELSFIIASVQMVPDAKHKYCGVLEEDCAFSAGRGTNTAPSRCAYQITVISPSIVT